VIIILMGPHSERKKSSFGNNSRKDPLSISTFIYHISGNCFAGNGFSTHTLNREYSERSGKLRALAGYQ
jgi:hypothetical protein